MKRLSLEKKLPLLSASILIFVVLFFPQTSYAIDIFKIAGDGLADALGWIAINVVLKLATLLTSLGGLILNFVINFTVVDMAENVTKAGSVNKAWETIRDVANMGFIFILLYAAIRLILGVGSGTQKLIVNIVVVAVLINFSLFFTKVVIDASNVLAVTFYGAIAPEALNEDFTSGLSGSLMEPMKLASLMSMNENSIGEEKVELGGTTLIIIGIMGSVVALIAAFVFFAVAILFVIRFVVLIFVMILSPLAFMAFVLPQLSKYKDQWWNALSGQAFFAPIYFMLTWIVIVLVQGLFTTDGTMSEAFLGVAKQNPDGTVTIAPSEAGIMVLMNFIVIIVLLIVSLIVAKEWSGKAGPAVSGATKWAMGAAGTAAYGGTGWLGRKTIGRAGQAIYDNEALRDKAPTSRLARLALAAGKKSGSSTFDFRATKVGEGTVGSLGAGKALGKGGFAASLKKEVEDTKKYADETFKVSDIATLRAEKKLDETKKSGDVTKIADAQREVDELKGLSEDESRKRKIREIRIAEGVSEKEAKKKLSEMENERFQKVAELVRGGMNEKDAEKEAENQGVGWKPKTEKGATNTRKEKYAEGIENSAINIPKTGKKIPFSFTRRHFGFGPTTKENILAASAIRKSTKDKKAAEKIADEIAKQAKEATDDSDSGSSPAGGATPPQAGGSRTPTPPTP